MQVKRPHPCPADRGRIGFIYWTKRYDLDVSDVLKAQEDIAERIAAAIEPVLESAELSRIATKRTRLCQCMGLLPAGSIAFCTAIH